MKINLASDSQRRIENIARLGTIAEVDPKNARARVKTGEIVTDFLPWLEYRTGNTLTFSAPDVGEQVLLIAPSGDLAQAVILKGLFLANQAPTADANLHIIKFKDGAVLSYQQEQGVLTVSGVKNMVLNATGDLTAKVGGSVNIESPSIVLKGDVSINGNMTISGISTAKDHLSSGKSGASHNHIGNMGAPTSPPQ